MSLDVLNVGESVFIDNSIANSEYHTHSPYAATTYNNNDEIRIPIQTQNLITLPSQSFLYIEGVLAGDDKKPIKTCSFINNGIVYLFSEIRYEIGGIVVDRVKNPGITSSMKGYISYTDNESKRLLNSGWSPLSNPSLIDENGNFNVCIPLRMLLGFAEDFRKIIMNVRQELVLIRNNTLWNAVQSTKPDEKAQVAINKILWKVPHITVADAQKLQLLNYIEKDIDLDVAFRSWELQEYPLLQETTKHTWAVKTANNLEKPRYIIVGFQSDKKNKTTSNMSHFDHCQLTNIKLYLNSEMYPYDNLNLDFNKKHVAILYEMYSQFQQSYYYKNQSEPCLTPSEFIKNAPLVVIDCSRQNETLKIGAVDIRLEFETSSNIPSNTCAYCLILHDRLVRYSPLTGTVKIL